MSTLAPIMLVLTTALLLAHAQEATEIGVDHLFAALDADLHEPEPGAEGPFVPVPRVELPLSAGVRSVMSSLGKIESVSKPVSGQCGKRMLLRALCPIQLGYDMA